MGPSSAKLLPSWQAAGRALGPRERLVGRWPITSIACIERMHETFERRCKMAYVKVRIPKYRVTKTGRVVKTGTVTRHVHIRKK